MIGHWIRPFALTKVMQYGMAWFVACSGSRPPTSLTWWLLSPRQPSNCCGLQLHKFHFHIETARLGPQTFSDT